MNPLIVLSAIVIALIGYPVGLLIAKLTKEELRAGKRWFKLIILACFLAIIASVIFVRAEALLFLVTALVFILLVALASFVKAKKQKRRRKRR